jgi:NADH:ubiquinone oxidoreductase subunit 6 (subunit J)
MLIKGITLFAFAVIFSSNAVYALLNLIIVFLLTFALLIKSNIEFIAYLYLLVYLGAVMMIFLFVTMLYNFKEIITLKVSLKDFFICLFILSVLEYFILKVLKSEVEELIFDEFVFNNKLLYFLDNPQFCNELFYFDLIEFSIILFNEE